MKSSASPLSQVEDNVCAIVVTYGDRVHYLEKVLAALNTTAVNSVIVVDNGSADRSAARLRELGAEYAGWLSVVTLKRNTGSAGGFKAGLAAFQNTTSAKFAWLLDDDNLPSPNALCQLRRAYKLLGGNSRNLLVSLRASRAEYVAAATSGRHVGILPNSFFGFHVRTWLLGKWSRRTESCDRDAACVKYPLAPLGYAPYGGLFLHREWLERAGLPMEEFFLYEDDHEYTMRIIANGGRIYLCAASNLVELEESWGSVVGDGPALISASAEDVRVFYSVRNRAFVESQCATYRPVYYLNVVLLFIFLAIKGLVAGSRPQGLAARLRLIGRAFLAGRRGDLTAGP